MVRRVQVEQKPTQVAVNDPSDDGQAWTAGCLFSGMGGFATGLLRTGLRVRWATDNDPFAAATFRHRFPQIPFIEADITSLAVDAIGPVDILVGGFPCQSFSQAGTRDGFEDPRGKLFFEISRLILEWSLEERPRMLILENVPHLMYGGGGTWFERVRRSLRLAGYWFRESSCWVANVKDYTDIPQDRERLFLVAASRKHFSYNPFIPPEESSSESSEEATRTIADIVDRSSPSADEDYLPLGNQYRRMIEEAMAAGQSTENLYQLRRSYVREKRNGLCPTLTANMGIGGHNIPFVKDGWGIRRLRVSEVASLQGFASADDLFPPDTPQHERYRLIGNAACPALVEIVANRCIQAMDDPYEERD